jgi:hypothetical protein
MPLLRRRIVGYSLFAAGVLILAGVVLALLDIPFAWAFELSALALAVAFGAVGLAEESVMRLAFAGAAVGWVLVAATGFATGEAGIFGSVGEFIAAVGGLAGGILVFRAGKFGRRARLVFLIAMIVTVLYLANTFRAFLPLIGNIILAGAWGLSLVASSALILRRR